MTSKATTVQEYLDELPEDRRKAISQLRSTVKKHLPKGFKEVMAYGMIGYVVPHSIYPPGYHCDPSKALPFACIASQKNFIALYHMGVYAEPKLLKWFTTEYPKHSKTKLDMGKSCIRFKKPDQIPHELIGELFTKISVDDYIKMTENALKK
jgi:hypothetical protein